MMPEWYVIIAALAGISLLGIQWSALLFALPVLALAILAPAAHACVGALRATFTSTPASRGGLWKMRALTAFLHMSQPLARLWGRIRFGLTPWRRAAVAGIASPWPWPQTFTSGVRSGRIL